MDSWFFIFCCKDSLNCLYSLNLISSFITRQNFRKLLAFFLHSTSLISLCTLSSSLAFLISIYCISLIRCQFCSCFSSFRLRIANSMNPLKLLMQRIILQYSSYFFNRYLVLEASTSKILLVSLNYLYSLKVIAFILRRRCQSQYSSSLIMVCIFECKLQRLNKSRQGLDNPTSTCFKNIPDLYHRAISQYEIHLHGHSSQFLPSSPKNQIIILYFPIEPMRAQTVHSTIQLRQISRQNITFPPKAQLNKECRICLSNLQESDNKFISPCECQGSMRYVHQKCIKEWLEVKVVRDIEQEDNEGGIECELCKRRISVELQVSKKCRPYNNICQIISDKLMLFLVCILGIGFSLSLIIYSAFQLGTEIKNGYANAPTVEKVVVLCSIVLNILLFIFFSSNLASFFMKDQAEIKIVRR